MNFEQVLEAVRGLSRSQGFYGRMLEQLENLTSEQRKEFEEALEENGVLDVIDLVMFLEQ